MGWGEKEKRTSVGEEVVVLVLVVVVVDLFSFWEVVGD